MKIVSLGPDKLRDDQIQNLSILNAKWAVYYYRYEEYRGDGTLILAREDGTFQIWDLSHCSCYGPIESDEYPDEVLKDAAALRRRLDFDEVGVARTPDDYRGEEWVALKPAVLEMLEKEAG